MPAEGIGKLIAYLGVDTVALEAGKARAGAALKDIDDRMNVTAATAGKLAGAIVVAGATMAAVMVKRTVEAIDAQGEMAQQIGISIQALGGLTFAGAQAGLSAEDLAGNMTKLNRNMAEAASGSKTQEQAFSDLGISVTDTNGNLRTADDVLMDLADRFADAPDGPQKTAVAMDVLGKSGTKMIPLLNQGSAALREQMQLAQQLGLVISNETAAAANQFADQMQVLSQVGQGFSNRLTAELLPTLTNVGSVLIDVAKDGDTMATASGALSTVLKGLVIVGLSVSEVFSQAGKWIGALAAAAVSAASGDYASAANILKERTADSGNSIETTIARIKKAWEAPADAAAASAMKQQAALLRTTETQRKAAEEAEKAAERQQKANAQVVASLQEQAATLGMTAGQAQVFKLQMDGATEAQIRAAEAARRTVDAFAALKEIGSIKIGAMDGDDAAVAALQEKYARLNEIIAANPQLQQQAGEAAAMLAQQYQNSVDTQIAVGQAGHQAFIDQQAQRIEAIKTQYATEIDLAMQKYAMDQEMLEQAMLNGVITEQTYRDISAQQEADHENNMRNMKIKSWDDLKKLSKLSWQSQASIMTGTLAEMTAALSTKSRTMFEINKAAAASNAAVRIPEMMSSAYNAMVGIPYVGPALGAAAAVAAGAFGAAQVGAIMSTSYGGGGGRGGAANVPSMATSSVGQSGAPAGPSSPSQTLAVSGLDGSQIFDGKTVRALAEKLVQFQQDGGKVVFQ